MYARIVQFLFCLNPKFQASSFFLCLYRPVCVEPVRKRHCWFSHEAAQISYEIIMTSKNNIGKKMHKYLLLNVYHKMFCTSSYGERCTRASPQ